MILKLVLCHVKLMSHSTTTFGRGRKAIQIASCQFNRLVNHFTFKELFQKLKHPGHLTFLHCIEYPSSNKAFTFPNSQIEFYPTYICLGSANDKDSSTDQEIPSAFDSNPLQFHYISYIWTVFVISSIIGPKLDKLLNFF